MKIQMNSIRIIKCSLGLALAVAFWNPIQSRAAEPAEGKMMMDGKMMERCQSMMKEKQKLQEEVTAQDAKLKAEVAAMNDAPDDKKSALMAAVVTKLVEQRTETHARMGKMQDDMMGHMMQHMQMGKESMS
jgi:hypothetical protein